MGGGEDREVGREDGGKPGSERVSDRSPCGDDRAQGYTRFMSFRETIEIGKRRSENTETVVKVSVRARVREEAKLSMEIIR